MHRNDDSVFLLYIEPNKNEKCIEPFLDNITSLMVYAFSKSKKGSANYSVIDDAAVFRLNSGYKGRHTTDCSEESDNHDYLLENGLIVNSLCIFYIKYYRNSIPFNDWIKIKKLADYYKVNINLPTTYNVIEETKIVKPPDFEKILVDELTKNINNHIIKNAINLK